MTEILGQKVPWTEPVSLTNRTHVAGVHQKAVMADKHTYEQDLGLFGVTEQVLLLGPLSGWHHIRYYLREVQYLDVSEEAARQITEEFKTRARQMNGSSKPREILMEIAGRYQFEQLPNPQPGTGILENLTNGDHS
jgi:homocitrate synthase